MGLRTVDQYDYSRPLGDVASYREALKLDPQNIIVNERLEALAVAAQ